MQNRNEAKCSFIQYICCRPTLLSTYRYSCIDIDRAIATSVENDSCDYNYFHGFNFQGPLSCRQHRCLFTICRSNTSNYRMQAYVYRQTMQTCPVRFTRGVCYLKVIGLFDFSSVTLYVIFLFSRYLIIVKTSGWFGRCVGWLSGSVSGIRESVSCENGI